MLLLIKCTGSSRLMRISLLRISLLRISLLRFFKTFHEYVAYAILCTLCYCDFWLMRFYVLFISLLRSICLMRLFPSPKSCIRQELSVQINRAYDQYSSMGSNQEQVMKRAHTVYIILSLKFHSSIFFKRGNTTGRECIASKCCFTSSLESI